MSYTPPAYNAADLTFKSGYVVPAYNAANLSLGDGTPTLTMSSGTTVAFFGKVDAVADYAIPTSTVVQFQHWYRDFVITASSSASFVTWQRDVQITTNTTPLFRPGFIAAISTGTTLNQYGIAAIQTSTNIPASSALSFAWRSTNNVDFSVVATSEADFYKRDNQPRRAVFSTGSDFKPKQSSTAKSAAAFTTSSSFAPRPTNIYRASYTAQGSTVIAGTSAYGLRAAFASPTSTTITFVGLNVHARAFNSPGVAVGAFASSYISNTPYQVPDYDTMLYVQPKRKDIFTGVRL